MQYVKKEIWICWEKPSESPSKYSAILSFLRPSEEDALSCALSDSNIELFFGRVVAQDVKDEALMLYTKTVACIGSQRFFKGRSLREELKSNNGNSLWWYHPVSFKDCEVDPTFNRIIQILVIDRIASEEKVENIVLWGADDAVADVLKTKYRIECRETKKKSLVLRFLRAFGSRIKNFVVHVYHWYLIRKDVTKSSFIPEVVFEGFWDWSVRPNKQHDGSDDRYFKSLPDLLEQQGIKTAWLLWFSPHTEPGLKNRSSKEVLNRARSYKNLIFLQKYLTFTDIIKSFSDFSPVIKYLSFARYSGFRELFNHNGLNLFALFKDQLLYHFISAKIPHNFLVEKACSTAFAEFRPKIALTFLEMFPYSLAFYAGAKQGCPETKLATMQHASYSREKTFIRLEPEIEFYGSPDNCPIPKPDYVFAMGELGKEIFQECGFPSKDIFLTGSARYDHVSAELIDKTQSVQTGRFNLLMVTSLDRDIEMDMVEAVYVATQDLPSISLFLRNHPFARMEEHPLFQPMSVRITVTQEALDEDLQMADLLLFSYSTVAEESLIRGIPVWQWRSARYNGSVFRDLHDAVPSFSRVADLREAIIAFMKDPARFFPTDEIRHHVLRDCFYQADGKASERIAEQISDFITDSSGQ